MLASILWLEIAVVPFPPVPLCQDLGAVQKHISTCESPDFKVGCRVPSMISLGMILQLGLDNMFGLPGPVPRAPVLGSLLSGP